MTRLFFLSFVLSALAFPARACWQAPDAACFEELWRKEALGFYAQEPSAGRLIDLIDWGAVPPGAEAAQALLQDVSYDDLVEHFKPEENSQKPLNPMLGGEHGPEPSFEIALLMLLGYFNTPDLPDVPPEALISLYGIAQASGDTDMIQRWYDTIPEHQRVYLGVIAPDGTTHDRTDPFTEAQAATLAALHHLRNGEIVKAAETAGQARGEAAFLAWIALARHGIEAGDMGLLAQAVDGMKAAFDTQHAPEFDQKAFDLALQAAEEEYARTGDPDDIVAVYESLDPGVSVLPTVARLSATLAHRYLLRQTGQTGDDGFDAALKAFATALRNRETEDDFSAMRNARTALRLGLDEEARRIIEVVDAEYPGIGSFALYDRDMPLTRTEWSATWLDLMIARYRAVVADPTPYETREYWDIWEEQYALDEAIEITRILVQYGEADRAGIFADEARNYLGTLELDGRKQSAFFDEAVAAVLLPPDEAISRMRALGRDNRTIAYEFARSGRYDQAIELIAENTEGLDLGHWMKTASSVPAEQREEYVAILRSLIDPAAENLSRSGYPSLTQILYVDAAVFLAGQGDWPAARGYFDRLEDTASKYGPTPAVRNRMTVLKRITALLTPVGEVPLEYPYDEFAL